MSIGLSLAFIVVALVFFFDFIQPEYGNLEVLKGQLSGEQSFLQTETQAVAQAQTLISEYKNQSQAEQNAALAMPTGEDLAGALAQVYGLAANEGIVVQSVGITAPALQVEGGASSTNITKPLGTISFQIQASGSYEALQSFLSGLQTNIRIFDVEGLSLASSQSGKIPDAFTYTIAVTTYYQAS